MTLGLLVSAAVLFRVGLSDALRALPYEDFNHPVRMLAAGQIASAGSRLDPGDDFSKDAVIEVPLRDSSPRRLQLAAAVVHPGGPLQTLQQLPAVDRVLVGRGLRRSQAPLGRATVAREPG
ncbi:hypothetical protein [Streptomyces sp. NPDC023588]|uniref:hypothetical protein n=1 Tax=Streptomyces sp. NPDC023588 TaxID=3154907 RepID=UPI0033F69286